MTDSTLTRGDSAYWRIPLKDESDNPYPLIDVTVWVTSKQDTAMTDEQALYQHWIRTDAEGEVTSASGMMIENDDPEGGVVLQRLSPEESVGFEEGEYAYDLQVRLPSTTFPGVYDIWTPELGVPEIVQLDYTRAIAPPEDAG